MDSDERAFQAIRHRRYEEALQVRKEREQLHREREKIREELERELKRDDTSNSKERKQCDTDVKILRKNISEDVQRELFEKQIADYLARGYALHGPMTFYGPLNGNAIQVVVKIPKNTK